jgi:hypothetical protein
MNTEQEPRPVTPEEAIEQADAIALFGFEAGTPLETWQLRRLPGMLRGGTAPHIRRQGRDPQQGL